MKANILSDTKNGPMSMKDWTIEALIDELAYNLCATNSCSVETSTNKIRIWHKYYDRAEWLLYRLNVWKPVPEFIINTQDLTSHLRKQLADLKSTPETLNHIVSEAVCRILESVDSRYFHLCSVKGKVRWRLD